MQYIAHQGLSMGQIMGDPLQPIKASQWARLWEIDHNPSGPHNGPDCGRSTITHQGHSKGSRLGRNPVRAHIGYTNRTGGSHADLVELKDRILYFVL